ncbi:MAG: hypothetical protein AAGJ19_09370 [Myxococcota bacterium]
MIEARVDWEGPWTGPLAPELHGHSPDTWQLRYIEGSKHQVKQGFAASHQLRAYGWPCPRPLGWLRSGSRGRLLLVSDARPLPKFSPELLQSLGRLVSLLAEHRLWVPRLSWTTLGLRRSEVVPLDLMGARRVIRDPTSKHLRQLLRLDLRPKLALLGLRAAACRRPDPEDWARQWWEELARGDTRSSGV